MTTSDTERVTRAWSSAWSSPGWGPAWKDAFEGLSAAQAAWRPQGASERVHSVWQILHHIVFWREVVVAGLDGARPTDDEIARRNWEAPAEVSEPAWAAARARYAASHRLIADAMARSEEAAEKLAEMLPHDAYHIGQVFTMRALGEGQ